MGPHLEGTGNTCRALKTHKATSEFQSIRNIRKRDRTTSSWNTLSAIQSYQKHPTHLYEEARTQCLGCPCSAACGRSGFRNPFSDWYLVQQDRCLAIPAKEWSTWNPETVPGRLWDRGILPSFCAPVCEGRKLKRGAITRVSRTHLERLKPTPEQCAIVARGSRLGS